MSGKDQMLPIAIIGGGPTGIDAALACRERGLACVVLEQGEAPGAGVGAWGHVPMFTPWSMNLSRRMVATMERAGIPMPALDRCPTGDEFREQCLVPLAATAELESIVQTGTRVLHLAREGVTKEQEIGSGARARRPFRLIVSRGGEESVIRAAAIIDCSGARALANSLGDGGVPAPGEGACDSQIARDIPDLASSSDGWASSRVLLVGAGHSAQTAARALVPLLESGGGHLTWMTRDPDPDWGAVVDDPLAVRAALANSSRRIAAGAPGVTMRRGAVVESLRGSKTGLAVGVRNGGGCEEIDVDRVLALTGRVGDHTIYRQLQVHECYATAGPMSLAATLLDGPVDCLAQAEPSADALRTPEPGFFLAGAKSYGRNSQYLLSVGYRQVDEILKMIAS